MSSVAPADTPVEESSRDAPFVLAGQECSRIPAGWDFFGGVRGRHLARGQNTSFGESCGDFLSDVVGDAVNFDVVGDAVLLLSAPTLDSLTKCGGRETRLDHNLDLSSVAVAATETLAVSTPPACSPADVGLERS
mmetsp:Transcript_59078/g.111409  ORF Transcript_59078/g.111409 Transcript_59078/m.111409 type:complete len:135 (-) Transcript_59078:174-578(-)